MASREADDADADDLQAFRRPFQPNPPQRTLKPVLVLASVVLVAAVITLVWWKPWNRWLGCAGDNTLVADMEAGLCFELPAGWTVEEDPIFDPTEPENTWLETTSLTAPEADQVVATIGLADGGAEAIPVAELEDSALTSVDAFPEPTDPNVEFDSRVLCIDGRDAATANAAFPIEGHPEQRIWFRATLVDLGDRTAVLMTGAVILFTELATEDGTVAKVNALHDSIAVV